jgi:mycothiol synthase
VIEARRTITEHTPDLENLRYAQGAAQAVYVLARVDGDVVGCGLCAAYPGSEKAFPFSDATVVPTARRQGVGTALLQAVSARARELGAEGLQGEVREDDEVSIRFVEKRGFVEIERQKEVILDLTRTAVQEPRVPEGIAIVSRAERPDLERGEYELSQHAVRDIPGLDSTVEETFEEWRAFKIERPGVDPELCFLALAGEELVGSAEIVVISGTAYHGLTAVARDWRGRGIAEALKRTQIEAAGRRGFAKLVTESQQDNAPMRRLNEKLGYEPVPGTIVFRGPLLV